jgi:beta-phosphoglucomutase-like phosphatase (HAD superfamily)
VTTETAARAEVTAPGFAAVLWDLDGTLVETEPYWIEAEYALAEKYGFPWSQEHALKLVGNNLLDSGSYIRAHGGLDLTPAGIVSEMLSGVLARLRDCVPWRPGARELLISLAGVVPCALVTMSYRTLVEPVLAELPPGTFSAVITGDEVSRGKPDPEPYLAAAGLLGVDAGDCLAIEDSDTGARSAELAGCLVLAVPNHVRAARGERRVFIDSLENLTAGQLLALRPH